MAPAVTLSALRESVGQELFVSDWVPITRHDERAFQRSTLLHEDYLGFKPDNGESWSDDLVYAWSDDAVSGFLLLSMIVAIHKKHLPLNLGGGYDLNHGLDQVRFLSPVLVGQRVRLRAELLELEEKVPGRVRCLTRNTLEVEVEEEVRPAMVADWISLLVTGDDGGDATVSGPSDGGQVRVPQVTRAVDFLHHWARLQPEAELDVFGSDRRTYADGQRDVRRCAAALLRAGVRRGDRVAALTTPRPEFLTLFLALSEIGAVWVGLSPRHSCGELEQAVSESEPVLLFALVGLEGRDYRTDADALAARVPSIRQTVTIGGGWSGHAAVSFDAFLAEGDGVPDEEIADAAAACREDDTALIVYTSGTTGRPKGAMISAVSLSHGCWLQSDYHGHPSLRTLAYLPVDHVGGVMDLGVLPVALGGCLVYQERFDPDEVLRVLQTERITYWRGLPTMFQLVVARPGFATADLSALEYIAWDGAAMPVRLIGALRRTGARLSSVYRLTESCVAISYADGDEEDDEMLALTVGRPDPRLDVRIVGEDGSPVAPEQPGEIQIHSSCMMQGYHARREASAAAFTEDGFLRTGDLGVERSDGRVRLVGRISEIFKSGGCDVYPREVEMVLERHPDVALAAVVGVPDPVDQEVGAAYVCPRPGTPVDTADLEALCKRRLANYKRPKHFVITTDLPLLANGKINKLALVELAHDSHDPGGRCDP